MKLRTLPFLLLAVLVASGAWAQDPVPAESPTVPVQRNEQILDYSEYTVKAYSISFFGGMFSGATYLDNQPLGDKTRITESNRPDELGPNDILGYDNLPLEIARRKQTDGVHFLYDSARKEIESGPAFGGRIGIFIADNFHLDMHGTYATGNAVTSMIFRGESGTDPETGEYVENGSRYVVDEDDGFSTIKGGLSLMYDARPATFWGITPRLGFGLGGVINSYTELEDKTALYLEGTFGLSHGLRRTLSIYAQADLSVFSYEIDELDYSNMVNYSTLTLGLSWFFDVLPAEVRAAHEAREH